MYYITQDNRKVPEQALIRLHRASTSDRNLVTAHKMVYNSYQGRQQIIWEVMGYEVIYRHII